MHEELKTEEILPLKQYILNKLNDKYEKKRPSDFSNNAEMAQLVYDLAVEYMSKNEKFEEQYVVAKFEGGNVPPSKKKENQKRRKWLIERAKGKDCVGSVYYLR